MRPLGFSLCSSVTSRVLMGFPAPLAAPAPAPCCVRLPGLIPCPQDYVQSGRRAKPDGFPSRKTQKWPLKEYKGCICITVHMDYRGDAVATIPLPLSGMFITPPCRHKHLTFPKAQPKTQPQPALTWRIDTASHRALTREQPPLVRNGQWHCISLL